MGSVEAVGFNDASYWEAPSISLGEKPDPIQKEIDAQKSLGDRIVADVTATKKTRYNLDQCVNVESYTDLFRQKTAQAWERVINVFSTIRTVVVLTSVTATLLISYPLNIVPFAIGIIGYLYLRNRISNASEQIELWNTPPYQKPAEQRTQAYLEPFLAIYRSQGTPNSLSSVLHPNEIDYLYKKYLTHFYETLLQENPVTDEEKKAWMARFLTLNPLSPFMMQSGWEKIPPAFEQLQQEYTRLFAEPITYNLLLAKFAPLSVTGIAGPARRSGQYLPPSYLYELEGLVIKSEHQIEELRNEYLAQREKLKASYYKRLKEFSLDASSLKLQTLNDQFEYDLKHLKDGFITKNKDLKSVYLQSLQAVKNEFAGQEPSDLDGRFEKKWNELQAIFIEDKNSIPTEGHYPEARNLLESIKKELNPQPGQAKEQKNISPKKTPDKACLDLRDALNCPFS